MPFQDTPFDDGTLDPSVEEDDLCPECGQRDCDCSSEEEEDSRHPCDAGEKAGVLECSKSHCDSCEFRDRDIAVVEENLGEAPTMRSS